MTIKGIIQEIIFRNNDNGYTVATLESNNEIITCVGKFPQISEGECVELDGSFTKHNRYGEQFNVTKTKIAKPTTKDGIVKYLSSGLIRGVGPVTALSIVNYFGEATLDVIEFNPSRLSEVRGISVKKAEEIGEAFNEIKKMQNSVMLMQEYNISTGLAVKIYNTYFDKTEYILKENPYKLCEDVDGIGFYTADKIAQKMGISELSEFRFRAGILHVLKENSDKTGNTFITKPNLESELTNLLRVATNNIEIDKVINNLIMDSLIKVFELNDNQVIMLSKLYNTEKIVGLTLNLLNELGKGKNLDVSDSIKY